METPGIYRILIFLAFVVSVYVLAAGVLIKKTVRQLRGIAPRSTKPQLWYSRIILWLAALGILCGAYGYLIEPYWPEVTRVRITSPKLAQDAGPVRIVVISDLHSDEKPRLEERLPGLIAVEKPDLILFAGDSLNSPKGIGVFKKCLTDVAKIAPTYAVRGNWDTAFWSNYDLFGGTGVTELDGRWIGLEIRGATVAINGLAVGSASRISEVLGQAAMDAFTLFVYHYPDEIDVVSSHEIDLYCAGHTHGGQVSLPWYGALITLSRFDKQYESGLYRKAKTNLYVTRGIGMEGGYAPRVRFCARPEVTVIEVVSTSQTE